MIYRWYGSTKATINILWLAILKSYRNKIEFLVLLQESNKWDAFVIFNLVWLNISHKNVYQWCNNIGRPSTQLIIKVNAAVNPFSRRLLIYDIKLKSHLSVCLSIRILVLSRF